MTNASNPYESPSAESKSRSWRPIDSLAAGLWLAIPIGVFVGRRLLLPVFEDFGVELPTATKSLLRPYSPVPFAIASFVVLLAIFSIPYGSMRRGFMWLACISGVLVGAVCLLSVFVPLLSLWQNLR
jgi:hypothetical protein